MDRIFIETHRFKEFFFKEKPVLCSPSYYLSLMTVGSNITEIIVGWQSGL